LYDAAKVAKRFVFANNCGCFLKNYKKTLLLLPFSCYLCTPDKFSDLLYKAMNNKIEHSGTIEKISGGCAVVRILQTSACGACRVAGRCSAAEFREKLVSVRCAEAAGYCVGDSVVVSISREVAFRALLLSFGVPFVLIVSVLLVVSLLSGNEVLGALLSLSVLVPYYFFLWFFRHRLNDSVQFEMRRK
jgi:positive regulator of sigma E activity